MSLARYSGKRNFGSTPEPKAKGKSLSTSLLFVVHRHKATQLHYDFRLEMEGVLKSWAVPKGPSMNPADKRLAMMVEDHPYDYGSFEGVIPEGNYGAGIVEIWDKGTYTPLDKQGEACSEKDILNDLAGGTIRFFLQGKKLKGEFALVHMKRSGDHAWLLIKHNDEYAVHANYNSETYTDADSPINIALQVKAGRTKRASK